MTLEQQNNRVFNIEDLAPGDEIKVSLELPVGRKTERVEEVLVVREVAGKEAKVDRNGHPDGAPLEELARGQWGGMQVEKITRPSEESIRQGPKIAKC